MANSDTEHYAKQRDWDNAWNYIVEAMVFESYNDEDSYYKVTGQQQALGPPMGYTTDFTADLENYKNKVKPLEEYMLYSDFTTTEQHEIESFLMRFDLCFHRGGG